MAKFFGYAEKYIRQFTWWELALLKLCLFSAGASFGLAVPKKARPLLALIAQLLFLPSYLYLILKFFRLLERESRSI